MDNFSKMIGWHPGYHVSSLDGDRLVLVGETESFLLKGRPLMDLFQVVDGNRTVMDILSRIPEFGQQALLLNTLEDLIGKGLVTEANRQDGPDVYHTPDFDREPVTYQCAGGRVELRIFTRLFGADDWVRWAETLTLDTPVCIVIADDYLDPRLNAINRTYIRENRPWLLIKPTGTRPLIGPFFTPQHPGTPCWNCLEYRMQHNQPVRQWLQRHVQKGPLPIPVLYNGEKAKKVLAKVRETVQVFIGHGINHRLQALDIHTLTLSDHPVNVLPQCPCCGDPGLAALAGRGPITLASSPKIHITDGGVRSVDPAKTFDKLWPYLSPITGVVGDLSLLPDQKQNGVPIYRSFFFKAPGGGQSPENHDVMQVSLGKGMSVEQSRVSALCESIERYAVQYRGDEWQVTAPASSTDVPAILPRELASFSEKQYHRFTDPGHPDSHQSCAVGAYYPDIPLRWTRAWSLTDEKPYCVPLTYCYANTPFDDTRFSRCNSNGCAAGNTLEEALLQGFLELVERDATAVWWYNRIQRPRVSLNMLPRNNLGRLDQTLADEWDYWVLDITHDFHIPVMAAVARHRKENTFRLGFGCHIHPALACQRALTELCQLIAIGDQGPAVFDFNRIGDEPFLNPNDTLPPKKNSDYVSPEHSDIKNDLLYCITKAEQLGLKTLAVDYTRPDLPIRTVRVIVPGLCHIWPQFANLRLINVPVALGWTQAPLTEDSFNPVHLLI